MEKILIHLLELNKRVIVPDLGAFIIRQQDPKEVVFNDLLAFDDGILTEHLMQKNSLSKSEAQSRIKQFVEKIKNKINKGDTYHFENLGSLKMDVSSRIEFSLSDTVLSDLETDVKSEHEDSVSEPKTEISAEAKPKSRGPAGETSESGDEADITETKPEEQARTSPDPVDEESPDTIIKVDKSAELIVPGLMDESNLKETERAEEEPVNGYDESSSGDDELYSQEIHSGESAFFIADRETEVDIDATLEEIPLEPDNEEPPFAIDESEENRETDPEPDPEPDEDMTELVLAGDKQETEPEPETLGTDEPVLTDEKNQTEPEPIWQNPNYREPRRFEEPITESNPLITYTQTDDSKRRSWPWIVGPAAFILILLAAAWFFMPDKIDRFKKGVSETLIKEEVTDSNSVKGIIDNQAPMETDEKNEPENLTSEAPMAENLDAVTGKLEIPQEDEETSLPETSPQVQSPVKRYYVVAGCFKDIRNARNYVQDLKEKGYNASVFGMREKLHAVSFNSHSTKQAAVEEMYRIRDSYDPKAWVLYY